MMDFLNSLKSLVKAETLIIDNKVFKLHYRVTVIGLLVASILLTSKQYFGDPIDCESDSSTKSVIDTYCWIYGTFIIKNTLTENILSGLGNYAGKLPTPYWANTGTVDNKDIITQKYYQWVWIVIFFLAFLFYMPRFLWKSWEGGRLRVLIKDLGGPIVPQSWNSGTRTKIVNYFLCEKYKHNFYAFQFAFCEFLNFSNVVFQIILMDWFLTGHFSGYGMAVATYKNENPMTEIFPKISKCLYYKYGPSGSKESRDALCILPLNIVNEKLFIILWFWLLILTTVSFLQLVYRVCFFTFPKYRLTLLLSRSRFLSKRHANIIIKKFNASDMFFIDLLGKNLNAIIFSELMEEIAQHFIMKNPNYFNDDVTFAA